MVQDKSELDVIRLIILTLTSESSEDEDLGRILSQVYEKSANCSRKFVKSEHPIEVCDRCVAGSLKEGYIIIIDD